MPGAQFKPEYYAGHDNASPAYLIDGVNPQLIATIAQFHNADNQALPSTAYGLLTGGVDQLINSSGNLDRKRAAYGDALATTGIEASGLVLWNGTGFDRQRSNVDTGALITASGATTTQTGTDQTNYNGRGLKVVLNMTVVGTGSVTLSIQGKDSASGVYYTILTGAAVTTNSTTIYTVYPGITATANVSASDILPRTWRVLVTANNANPTTYTVGASVIL